jgi:hypothetical protein
VHHMVLPHLSAGSTLVAVGVLGAVVMPHNMYLHSEIIQNREWKGRSEAETRRLLRFEFVDTLLAMLVGLAINAAMIIVAASVFHSHGRHVNDLIQAQETLRPLAGNLASVIFGIGLLLAGVSSSMTAALAAGVTFNASREQMVQAGDGCDAGSGVSAHTARIGHIPGTDHQPGMSQHPASSDHAATAAVDEQQTRHGQVLQRLAGEQSDDRHRPRRTRAQRAADRGAGEWGVVTSAEASAGAWTVGRRSIRAIALLTTGRFSLPSLNA